MTTLTSKLAAIADQLPAPALALFTDALALFEGLPAGYSADDMTPVRELFHDAMACIDLPANDPNEHPFATRPVPPAATLTAAQRALLTALVDASDLFWNRFPVPCGGALRRQWLGLDPPGALWVSEGEGSAAEPRYFGLRRLLKSNRAAFGPHLDALPPVERAQLLVEIDLASGDLPWNTNLQILACAPLLDGSLGAWAEATAERILRGKIRGETMNLDHYRSFLVFTALVKANIPITPRYEALLRYWPALDAAFFESLVAAIPAVRREAALLACLDEMVSPNDRVTAAARLLATFPWLSLAIYADTNTSQGYRPKVIKQAIQDACDTHPTLAAALDAWRNGTLAAPASTADEASLGLRLTSHKSAAELGPLTDLQAAQLEAAAHLYDGTVASAAQIIAGESDPDEPILPQHLAYLRIEDATGTTAFDVWAMMVDSGTIFRSDTTDVVATIVQFSVDCADPALSVALSKALREPMRR